MHEHTQAHTHICSTPSQELSEKEALVGEVDLDPDSHLL